MVCPNWLWGTLTRKHGPGGGGELGRGGGGGVTPSGIKQRGLVQRCFQEGVRATKQGPGLCFLVALGSPTKMAEALCAASLGEEEGPRGGARCEGTDTG